MASIQKQPADDDTAQPFIVSFRYLQQRELDLIQEHNMTDKEFTDLLESAGVETSANTPGNLEGYPIYDQNLAIHNPFDLSEVNCQDLRMNSPSNAPFDPFIGSMLAGDPLASAIDSLVPDMSPLGLSNMEASISGIKTIMDQTAVSLQNICAKQSALKGIIIDLEEKLSKLKNNARDYSGSTFNFMQSNGFATCPSDFGELAKHHKTQTATSENFNLEDYLEKDSWQIETV